MSNSNTTSAANATALAVMQNRPATSVAWPVDADELALTFPEFAPSQGNLWGAPGVSQSAGIVNRPNYSYRIAEAFYAASLNLGMRPRGL